MANIFDNPLNSRIGQVLQRGRIVADAVKIKLGSENYEGWESVTVTKSFDSIASGFQIQVADKWRQVNGRWPFKPGEQTRVYIGAQSVLNGYVDTLSVEAGRENRSIQISGRSKTADLVDSSVETTSGEFRNQSLFAIARTLCSPFGVGVSNLTTEAAIPIDLVRVNQGETVFEVLYRLAMQNGVVLTSDAEGSLVIANRGSGFAGGLKSLASPLAQKANNAAVLLAQGDNILAASASYDEVDRFQKYIIKGQTQTTDFFSADKGTVEATATDEGVSRPRSKVIVAENAVNKDKAQKRANWEATTRAARSVNVNVTIQGWLRPDGALWDVNQLVEVDASFVGVQRQKLLISAVTFTKDESGTFTQLKLTRADAFDPKPNIPIDNDVKQGFDFSALQTTDIVKEIRNATGGG
jgi:prophage tail gpP-like protein